MNPKTLEKITIYSLIIMVGAVLFMGYLVYDQNQKMIESEYKVQDMLSKIDYSPTSDVIGDIRKLGRKFSDNHEYIVNEYDCTEFAGDFNEVLQQLGYNSHTVSGCSVKNSSCHRWIRITLDFEPIWGGFTDYSEDYIERGE